MKIGVVVPGFSSSDTDWCIPALASYVRKLSEHHGVRVFALRYPHHDRPYRTRGADVLPLGGGGARGLATFGLVARALRAVKREHRRDPFDVLHAFWADEPGYVATEAARKLGLSALVSVAGGELVAMPTIGYGGRRGRWNRWFLSRALRRAEAVGVGSTETAVQLEGAHRTASFLPLGVDVTRFRPRTDDAVDSERFRLPGEPSLLHVASLTPVKDQATLVAAFSRVVDSWGSAVLHVVGEGPERAALERQCDDLGLRGHVRFHGAVDHADIAAYYRAADLLVQSSRHEAQGMAVLEAAACGLPVVGTDVGVLRDLAPQAPGVVVAPGDAAALAAAIAKLTAAPAALRRARVAMRKRAVAAYSLDACVERFTATYERIRTTGSPRS